MHASRTVVILEMLICLVPFTWFFPFLILFGDDFLLLICGLGLVTSWTIGLHFLLRGRWPLGDMKWLWIGALAGMTGAVILFFRGVTIVVPAILVAGHWGAAAWQQRPGASHGLRAGRMLPLALSIWFLGWTGLSLAMVFKGQERDGCPAEVAAKAERGPQTDLSIPVPRPRVRSVVVLPDMESAASGFGGAAADSS